MSATELVGLLSGAEWGGSGAGEAAASEVWPELDMAQAPAARSFGMLVVGDGGLGWRAAP